MYNSLHTVCVLYIPALVYATTIKIALIYKGSHNTQKVSTITSKSPLSSHFRAVSRMATIIRLILNYSASEELQLCTNLIVYNIVIVKLVAP